MRSNARASGHASAPTPSRFLHLYVVGQVRAEVLGTDARRVVSLHQPRQLAVLALLALEERPLARDEIAAMLWGDSSDARARASLSQVLHSIRRVCPADPFVSEGRSVRLAAEAVACDAVELYHALTEPGPHSADVLQRTHGGILPGFVLPGSHAFQEWCEQRRAHFDLEVADFAWKAADAASNERDGLRCLEHAAAMRPWDEAILRRRMQLLATSGQPAAAQALYERFTKQIRDEFGRLPAAATREAAYALTSEELDSGPAIAASIQESGATRAPPNPHDHSTDTSTDSGAVRRSGYAGQFVRWSMGRVPAAVVLTLALLGGALLSFRTFGSSTHLPAVTLGAIRITGGSDDLAADIRHRLTAVLGEQEHFRVAVSESSRSHLTLTGQLTVQPELVTGSLLLSDRRGRVVSVMPISFSSASAPALAQHLGRIVLDELAATLPTQRAGRAVVDFERTIAEASRYASQGSIALADETLAALANRLENARLPLMERTILFTRIGEERVYNALQSGHHDVAQARITDLLASVAPVLRAGDATAKLRLAEVYYLAAALAPADSSPELSAAIELIASVPVDERPPGSLKVLSAAFFASGDYAEAYAAADALRRTSVRLAADADVVLLLFRSAFNLGRDRTAAAECEAVRERLPDQWPSVACAAFLFGWTEAGWSGGSLVAEMAALDRNPGNVMATAPLQALVAAAMARRGEKQLADSLLRQIPSGDYPVDYYVFQAAALRAEGRTAAFDSAMADLHATPAGRQAARLYERLLRD